MSIFETSNLHLRYQLEGRADAPYLVLSNALGAGLDMWAPQMPSLLEHFRILRYDARGHGQSGVPPGPYTIAQMGGDVLALMESLNIKRAHFCGLSMGGMVGMWLAAKHPERIDRLVLCNTGARVGTNELWETRIETVNKGGMEAVVPAVISRWFTADFMARVPAKVDLVRRMLLQMPAAGYAAGCAAIRDADLRELVRNVVAPTLVIAGMRDKSTPPQDSKLVAERIPGALYAELKTAHLSNWEAPQSFVTKVIAFLAPR